VDPCEVSDLRLWREGTNWHLWTIDANGKPAQRIMDGVPDVAGYTRRVSYYCDRCKGHWPRYESAVYHTQAPATAQRRPQTRWRGTPGDR